MGGVSTDSQNTFIRIAPDSHVDSVHAERQGVAEADRDTARTASFAQNQARLRASPLSKRYGWGTHRDDDGACPRGHAPFQLA